MKKFLFMLCTCLMLLVSNNAFANEQVVQKQAIDWEISMMPKPTAEEIEAARWSVVVENDLGIYAYDMGSLDFEQVEEGKYDFWKGR